LHYLENCCFKKSLYFQGWNVTFCVVCFTFTLLLPLCTNGISKACVKIYNMLQISSVLVLVWMELIKNAKSTEKRDTYMKNSTSVLCLLLCLGPIFTILSFFLDFFFSPFFLGKCVIPGHLTFPSIKCPASVPWWL